MKAFPLKVGIILLSIFQVNTILTRWGEDTQGTVVASIILIGCIFLLMADMFFKSDNHTNHPK